MTPNDLRRWQAEMVYTYDTAAQALGVSRRTYAYWLKKPDTIPPAIDLACAALVERLAPYSERRRPDIYNGMRPVHPGEALLEDYLKPLDMSAQDLAAEIADPGIVSVIEQRAPLTAVQAEKLVERFGGDTASWINLQNAYDLRTAEIDSPGAARE